MSGKKLFGADEFIEGEEEETGMTAEQKLRFAETILFGLIDGIVAYFSAFCNAGMFQLVDAAFRLIDYYEIWIPSNLMKFNMSLNNLVEAGNVVFAYCDVSHFETEIAHLAEYTNWEQYPVLAGRIGGVMITDFWVYKDCIVEGRFGNNGFDIGMCVGKLTSLLIDTLF